MGDAQMQADNFFPAAQPSTMQNQMNSNICIKHFPEPIIFTSSDEPMCKKCIPLYLEKIKKTKKEAPKDEDSLNDQADKLQQLFGTSKENQFQSEKNQIQNCMIRLDDFKGDFRYINEDIDERVTESTQNLENLPELMCQIFQSVEKVMA